MSVRCAAAPRAAGSRLAAASLALAAGLGLAAPAAAQLSTAARNQAVAAVHKVLADQQENWNHGDLAGFMDGYWKSDSLTFFSGGDVQRGWQAAYDRYVRRYQSEGQEMGRLDFELFTVLILAPDAALVRGAWYLKRADDAPHGLFTLLLRRFPNGWKIVHDHTSSAE